MTDPVEAGLSLLVGEGKGETRMLLRIWVFLVVLDPPPLYQEEGAWPGPTPPAALL